MSISGRNRRRQNTSVDLDDLPEFMDENESKELANKSSVIIQDDNTPPEIAEFLAEAGVPNQFSCHIYKTLSNGKRQLQNKLDSQLLDENEIGKRYGSGDYSIHLQWKTLGAENEVVKKSKWFNYTLGPEYDVAHAQYRRENLSLINAVTPQQATPTIDPLAALKALSELVPKPVEHKSSMENIVGLIGAIAPIFMKFLDDSNRRQDEANRRQEKLLEKLAENNNKDEFGEFFNKMKMFKEVFPDPEVKPEGGDKLDRLIDGGIELIKEFGPQLIQRANNPVIGGFVRKQIAADPRWDELLANDETREQALDHLYSTLPPEDVTTFLTKMGVAHLARVI